MYTHTHTHTHTHTVYTVYTVYIYRLTSIADKHTHTHTHTVTDVSWKQVGIFDRDIFTPLKGKGEFDV
jgi:hypothetical protein